MFCLANVLRAQRKMCFARAIFRRLNFQSWSENVVFVHFDLKMGFAPKRGAIFHFCAEQLLACGSSFF